MYLNLIIENFELIVISILLVITISTISIFFLQSNFIKNTSKKIDNYHDMIKINNSFQIKILPLNRRQQKRLITIYPFIVKFNFYLEEEKKILHILP